MFKVLLFSLFVSAIGVTGLAIYLLTEGSLEKTMLMMPPLLSVFYFLYAEANEGEELDVVVEQWIPLSAKN